MKILMHICCSPCTVYPYSQLKDKAELIKGFFYNPNIHPFQEYNRRKQSVKRFSELNRLEVIYRDEYDVNEYFRGVIYREKERCRFCYYFRLQETAKIAQKSMFEYFTTTLLLSPYQDHELLKKVADEVSQYYGVTFYYQDWRNGWHRSQKLSKQMNLYRQQYCGCIYSEYQRLKKKCDRLIELPLELEKAKLFHQHIGPYLVIGMKMGKIIIDRFGTRSFSYSILTYTGYKPPLSCIIDGLQLTTPCTVGNGGISVVDESRPHITAVKEHKKISITLKSEVIDKIDKECNKHTQQQLALEIWYMNEHNLFQISVEE